MLTTTIGAWPKPDDVPIRDWFGGERSTDPEQPTAGYAKTLARYGDRLTGILDRATVACVRAQDELGIDLPTDGEIRRENYIHYQCRHLAGIDFSDLSETVMRGHTKIRLPTITGRVAANALPFLVRDWEIAQAATRKPVKMTLPGPMTIGDSLADAFYEGDERRRGADLADALNVEVRRLADAGCPWIQIDEPLFARRAADGLAFGIEHVERAFHRVPREIRRVVHVCCGYPRHLDDEDYPKAPNEAYGDLADALDEAAVDVVSIEDAHRPNDLALLEKLRRTTVILGVIAIARSRVEEADEIRDRLRAALEHIDRERLIAGPDCGLGFLGPDLARKKLTAMVAASRAL